LALGGRGGWGRYISRFEKGNLSPSLSPLDDDNDDDDDNGYLYREPGLLFLTAVYSSMVITSYQCTLSSTICVSVSCLLKEKGGEKKI